MKNKVFAIIITITIVTVSCAQIQSLFGKKDSGATGADQAGWAAITNSGTTPDWITDEGYSSYLMDDELGMVFLSMGESTTIQKAESLAEDFARLNAGYALRDYAANVFADALEITLEDVWEELTNTLIAINLWEDNLQFADTYWEKGEYIDSDAEQSKGLFGKKEDVNEQFYRYYETVFLTEEEIEQMISSAWFETRDLYNETLIESVEGEFDYLTDTEVIILEDEILPKE